MEMSSSPPDDFVTIKDEECLVCGVPVKGLHFQVNACRACAAFFRRSVKSKLVYRCQRGTGRCDLKIKVHGKPLCRYCRMKKCKYIGMRMEIDYTNAPNSCPDDIDKQISNERRGEYTFDAPQIDGKRLIYDSRPLIAIIKEDICKNTVCTAKGITLSPLQTMCQELKKFCNQNAPNMCDVELVTKLNSEKYMKFMENFLLRLVRICTSCEDFVKINDDQKFPVFRHFYQCFNYVERAYQTMILFGHETTDLRYLFECTQAIDVGMTNLATGDAKDEEVKQLFEPLKQRMFGHLLNPMKILRPTIFEFTYIAVNIMWNLIDVSDITPETQDVAKEIVERSATELHNYYKHEIRLSNYSNRHASLLRETAKVLVINPFFAPSHFAFLSKLADILAENGHNVTMLISEIDTNNVPALPSKANVVIRHKFTSEANNFDVSELQNLLWNPGFEPWDTKDLMAEYKSTTESRCERLLTDSEFAESMKQEKFDIGLLEPNDMCGYGFFQLINLTNHVNAIPMSLAGMIAVSHGLPGRSSEIFPNAFDYHPELSFSQRFMNYMETEIRSILHGRESDGIASNVIRRVVDPNFDGNDAIGRARYSFLNTEEHIDFPRPISHKIIYIGGITVTQSTADNLPEDYKAIFANAKKGVVLVSFGSIASSYHMPSHVKQAFLDTFEAFADITFIWKYENTSDPIGNDLPNLYKKTWVSQKEILAHPKLLFFVTHGGMNSVLESAMAGVPLLGIPLFADQIRNIKMLELRGSVVYVAKNDITGKSLIGAVRELTENSLHRQRAREIAALVKTNSLSPTQRFILHFNIAVEFGHTHDYLDIGHRKLNFVQFYNLDVLAVVGFVALVVVLITILLFVFIVKKIVQRCPQLQFRVKTE